MCTSPTSAYGNASQHLVHVIEVPTQMLSTCHCKKPISLLRIYSEVPSSFRHFTIFKQMPYIEHCPDLSRICQRGEHVTLTRRVVFLFMITVPLLGCCMVVLFGEQTDAESTKILSIKASIRSRLIFQTSLRLHSTLGILWAYEVRGRHPPSTIHPSASSHNT